MCDDGNNDGGDGCASDCTLPLQLEGQIAPVDAPETVAEGKFENQTTAHIFAERTGYTLGEDLPFDYHAPTYELPLGIPGPAEEGVIPAGTEVSSYFVHFDVPGDMAGSDVEPVSFTITSSSEILALIVYSKKIRTTDEIVGAPGVEYQAGPNYYMRGLDEEETVSWSSDRRTLEVTFDPYYVDQFRLVTRTSQTRDDLIVHNDGVSPQSPPSSVELDAVESDDNIILFEENTSTTLASDVDIDGSPPRNYSRSAHLEDDTISAGTAIQSYLVHFDPVAASSSVRREGSVTLPCEILGLVMTSTKLDQSDNLSTAATTYPSSGANPNRGVEMSGGSIWTRGDNRSLGFFMNAENDTDQIRVLCAAQ